MPGECQFNGRSHLFTEFQLAPEANLVADCKGGPRNLILVEKVNTVGLDKHIYSFTMNASISSNYFLILSHCNAPGHMIFICDSTGSADLGCRLLRIPADVTGQW